MARSSSSPMRRHWPSPQQASGGWGSEGGDLGVIELTDSDNDPDPDALMCDESPDFYDDDSQPHGSDNSDSVRQARPRPFVHTLDSPVDLDIDLEAPVSLENRFQLALEADTEAADFHSPNIYRLNEWAS